MTYEYKCDGCGHTCTAEQRITDAPKKKCPSCGKMKLVRQISGSGAFSLKGGGWYADGYGGTEPIQGG